MKLHSKQWVDCIFASSIWGTLMFIYFVLIRKQDPLASAVGISSGMIVMFFLLIFVMKRK